MPYYEFWWDERALEKIDLNDVAQHEVESVICNPKRVEDSLTSGLPFAVGFADDGRLIGCVYEQIDEFVVRPVTAFCIESK